ncbi:molybdenum cofactor biosynthesis protein MoaE [Chamaesiphon sp. OTE_20_metabat_361]|uniref:molybdenum cofactor biosynthesis protein MoaE n=1 Tax=Chamaesiphon sp. OTE_20_metabat_361 TaxID=2964689 RepID=UPI00286A24AD|nr:molybdenum cofactor biosynthesis protein MoaE [Chamaesiphon sp. OTE_20_metabat_361]
MTTTPLITHTSAHPADRFAIGIAPLLLDEVYQLADDPANGAVVIMSGTVRDRTDGQAVEYLEYQAYEPMAMRVFAAIGWEIRSKWADVTHVVIYHRVGKLKIGEISVLVAVGCPHRGEAFAACQYAIDTLKHQAPIWKKEWYGAIEGKKLGIWVSIGACEQLDCP